ncbi:MAG: hypothetical protein EOP46_14780 [Sphingobacteriaceae bacterium]|nr:MAG: hypothetical protein EOP46_14780 [Sphingobacteriaceae bacterium]
MTEAYILFGGLALFHLGLLFYHYYQKRKMNKTEVEIADFRWNEYLKLRQETLSVNPLNLGIELPEVTETAFGIAKEVHYDTGVHFVIIFKTGEIWALSTENGRKDVLFNADNETVMGAVSAAFDTAQYNFARMRRNFTCVLEPGDIKFHILTNIDVYSTNSFIWNTLAESFVWEELWDSINQVIEEIQDSDAPAKQIPVYWKRRESSRKDLY